MPSAIEDYALIGDCNSCALVSRDGSIDWFCAPRFDSPAGFAALLGTPDNGRWLICPSGGIKRTSRRYREGTLILETLHETETGVVRIIDFMSPNRPGTDVVRIIEGVRGTVEMEMEFIVRFGYGAVIPWVRKTDNGLLAVAGPDALLLRTPVEMSGEDFHTVSRFTVSAGDRVPFTLDWYPSHLVVSDPTDPEFALEETEAWWTEWSSRSTYDGQWSEAVSRSLVTLKALTYAPTGGIVAAPTTSLPEALGGTRNWDYRYCWLRDATFTLYALMGAGYRDEAREWREWLLRAVAGKPDQIQIMYGIGGERQLPETELDWLPGYEGARPVRIGNGAHLQRQLDTFGEVMDGLYFARMNGLDPEPHAWNVQLTLMDHLESNWEQAGSGIWEIRGPEKHFTYSKVMAWVAFDRAVKSVENTGLNGPVDHWRELRDVIHRQVCAEGFDSDANSFTQYYGGKALDASLLMMPLVGFLEPSDPRIVGTVAAIQDRLTQEGFLLRYETSSGIDGLPDDEGVFLLCTLWLADNLTLQGRMREARELFERVLAVRNDVGLLSEEYDPVNGRQLGNFPQAYSHVGLINTARNLDRPGGPAETRSCC